MFVSSAILASGCFSQPSQGNEEWDQGVLVWSRGTRLEALQAGQKTPRVLRVNFKIWSQWNMSFDGRKLAFAEMPSDVNFFNASAGRSYSFIVPFNARQNVFLAAYGPKAVGDWSYQTPSFDQTGKRIVVNEAEVGQFMQDSSARWVAIYDVASQRRLFDSTQLIKKMAPGKARDSLQNLAFRFPALSPDGHDVVCLATRDDGDSIQDELAPGQKAPPTLLVHFDLVRKTGEVLAAIDDQLSMWRAIYRDTGDESIPPQRNWKPRFAWHPTQKKVVFNGPAAPSEPAMNLFSFDFSTRILTRVTEGKNFDFCPQWTLDGKSLLWLRKSLGQQSREPNRIFRAEIDGKNARSILPQIRGVDQFQIVAKIADWTRYRKLPVEALAGKDK